MLFTFVILMFAVAASLLVLGWYAGNLPSFMVGSVILVILGVIVGATGIDVATGSVAKEAYMPTPYGFSPVTYYDVSYTNYNIATGDPFALLISYGCFSIGIIFLVISSMIALSGGNRW